MIQYDVAFIGNRHATWQAAIALRKAGKSVVLIEKAPIARAYDDDAQRLLDVMAQHESSQNSAVDASWEALMADRRQANRTLSDQMSAQFAQLGIAVIQGTGILMGHHMIQVGKQKIWADNIVLNTGQQSTLPAITGKEFLHDRQDFLNLDHLPAHLTIIGAGVTALEFASLALQLGSTVTLLTHGSRAAKAFAPRYVTKLLVHLQAAGADIRFHEPVNTVAATATGYTVTTESGLTVQTDYVLAATGQHPNVSLLGLENAGIHTNRQGIIVDDHLRANGANIYAIGNVVAKSVAKLAATTTFEANYIAEQILGETATISYPVIPSVLSTLPSIAQVGTRAAEAAGNTDYHIVRIPYGKHLKAATAAEMTVVLANTHRLVGADIYGVDAPDLVTILTMIIDQRLTATDLTEMIGAFPTPIQGILDTLLPFLTPVTTEDMVRLDA